MAIIGKMLNDFIFPVPLIGLLAQVYRTGAQASNATLRELRAWCNRSIRTVL
nr:hypothetical protein [Paracoccus saliphilus]